MIAKSVLVSAALFALAAVAHGQQIDCCAYPITISITATNVTIFRFTCDEPMKIYCALAPDPDETFRRVAAVGKQINSTESIPQNIIASDTTMASADIVCDAKKHLWHGYKRVKLYNSFYCAYQKADGSWIHG
ncbi:unnamed protein product [Caenorhabditis sp. 36 PRJEB53466]|nr:unnamed protein product [Caenorhabditis sp. 36 PRJEB53466]